MNENIILTKPVTGYLHGSDAQTARLYITEEGAFMADVVDVDSKASDALYDLCDDLIGVTDPVQAASMFHAYFA